jgi:hypothetical protein
MKPKTKRLLIVFGAIILIAILKRLIAISNIGNNFPRQIVIDFSKELIIAMMAGFFGPLVGFITGCLGELVGFCFLFFEEPAFWHWVVIIAIAEPYNILKFGLYGLFIGIFWKKYGFFANIITLKSILLFCIVKIISDILFLNVINWLLLSYKYDDYNTFFILIAHIYAIIINSIIYTIPCFVLLLIYSRVKKPTLPG